MMSYRPHESSVLGLKAGMVALACYLFVLAGTLIPVLGWALFWGAPLILLFEKKSQMVRLHAAQAFSIDLFVNLLCQLLMMGFAALAPRLGLGEETVLAVMNVFGTLASMLATVLLAVGSAAAFCWRWVRLPVVGWLAAWLAKKIPTKAQPEEFLRRVKKREAEGAGEK